MAKKKKLFDRPMFQYVPRVLNQEPKNDLYKEYSRLRKIALKRIKRREEAGYKYSVPDLPTVTELKKQGNVTYSLIKVVRFLNSKLSTVSGIKQVNRSSLKALRKGGYTFLNQNNLSAYADMMKYVKSIVGVWMRYQVLSDGTRVAIYAPDVYKHWFEVWQSASEEEREKKVRDAIYADLRMEGVQL